MTRSVEQQVRIAYLGALIVLMATGAVSSLNMIDLASSVRQVDQSRRMMEAVAQLKSHLAEGEAAAHVYLLSGYDPQLTRYHENVNALDTDLARVAALRTRPASTPAADTTLAALVRQKVSTLESALALARAGRPEGAARVAGSEDGLALSAAITRELESVAVEESARVDSSRNQVLELVRLTLAVLGLGFLFAVSITALATRRIEREMAERRKAESDALQAKEAAEAANRAKTDFLARMSHELRTPLNSVIGFSNVLLKNRGGNLRDQDSMLLTRIHDNGLQLLQLIDDLLDLSRIEAGKQRLSLSDISLTTVVREAVAQLEERAGSRDLALQIELPPRVVPIQADARKLRQVLLNLIGNAIKFTDAGGITVRVDVDERDVPTRIQVSDTGIGIPESQQSVIFGPFERGVHIRGSGREGTGLGLAIARSMCEVMGYELTVDSEVGRGSTFTVTMRPIASDTPRSESEEVRETVAT
ncbi:MAG TPA: ATP-binding protein [Gemmatimonadaceae bacterium]|nr:ATP-binding protein [Gemmatimonadaceae bacterium]